MRVNVAPGGQARLVMRQRGNQRLVLNANLWPEMKVTLMDGGKVTPRTFRHTIGSWLQAGRHDEEVVQTL